MIARVLLLLPPLLGLLAASGNPLHACCADNRSAARRFSFKRQIVNLEISARRLSATAESVLVRAPAGTRGVWYGAIDVEIGVPSLRDKSWAALFAIEYKDTIPQRVWLDANLNRDFLDDPAVQLFLYPPIPGARSFLVDRADRRDASNEGSKPSVARQKVRVILEPSRPGSSAPIFRVQLVYAPAGRITMERVSHRAVLIDGNMDGIYSTKFGDGVFIDFDDDGIIEVDAASPEFGPFGAPFQMGNCIYTVDQIDPGGREITIRSAEAPDTTTTLQPGGRAPTFQFVDLDGRFVSLDSYRGKFVLLDFWTSWCGTCEYQAPRLTKLYEKYHPYGLEIVGFSFDESDSSARVFRSRHGQRWPTSHSGKQFWEDPIGRRYRVKGAGTMYLIDPGGVLDGRYTVVDSIESTLRRRMSRVREIVR